MPLVSGRELSFAEKAALDHVLLSDAYCCSDRGKLRPASTPSYPAPPDHA